ncbi:MAG: FecR domain-containing protein [Saprospiraceae bacterium]
MEDVKYNNLIGKYLSGNMSPPEKDELMSWAEADHSHKDYLDEMIGIWGKAEDASADFEVDIEAAWAKVDQRLPSVDTGQPNGAKIRSLKSARRRWLQMVAAAVLVLMAAWWWNAPSQTEAWVAVNTMDGSVKTVNLPDGSEIWLNAHSRLSYPESFTDRQVKLEGEAFFEVERMEDSPFVIYSGGAKTTVLGTSFNVRAYPEENSIEVSVTTGTVAFEEQNGGEKVILKENTAAVLNRETEKITAVDNGILNATSWKTQVFNFENIKMKDVFNNLSRHFGVRFEIENKKIEERTILLKDQPAGNLSELLEIVKYQFSVQFDTTRMNTDKVIIVK